MDMEHTKLYNLCLSEESNKILWSRYACMVKNVTVYVILLLHLVAAHKTVLLIKAYVA